MSSDGSTSRATAATVRRARELSWASRWLALEALFLVTGVKLLIRIAGVQRTQAILRSRLPVQVAAPVEPAGHDAVFVARVIKAGMRRAPIHATCLHRSLALWWLMRRRHYDCRLCFGARRRGGILDAHAWVELQGVVLSEDGAGDPEYVRMSWAPLERNQ